MIIENRLPGELTPARLRELIEFAADGTDLRGVYLELGSTYGLDGYAAGLFRTPPYRWTNKQHPNAEHLVRCAFPAGTRLERSDPHWPCTASPTPSGPGRSHLCYLPAYRPNPPARLNDYEEEIVYIFAHEIHHLQQWRIDRASGWRSYLDAAGEHDSDRLEREAESVGLARLSAFRTQRASGSSSR
jgi:hypothetical protein